jgi:hypothetical protein
VDHNLIVDVHIVRSGDGKVAGDRPGSYSGGWGGGWGMDNVQGGEGAGWGYLGIF